MNLKIFIYLIILSPLCVKGLVCDNTTKVRLQKLAQNITTSYDYVEQNGTVNFNITFLNLNSELYLVDTVNEKDIYYSDTSLTLNGFESGKNLNLKLEVLIHFAVGVFYITFMSQLLTLIHIIMIRFVKEFLINIVTSGKKMIYLMMNS